MTTCPVPLMPSVVLETQRNHCDLEAYTLFATCKCKKMDSLFVISLVHVCCLQDYCAMREYRFCRLDGSTDAAERQVHEPHFWCMALHL